ncbi:hypothetical protein E4U54_008710 [Claviceps lovelessii]|nr:hypothetical protein E4U54_008710 [Claviceps lovelessii]
MTAAPILAVELMAWLLWLHDIPGALSLGASPTRHAACRGVEDEDEDEGVCVGWERGPKVAFCPSTAKAEL